MIEYTRELLNSNCDLEFISAVVERAHGTHKLIAKYVLNKIKENKRLCCEAKSHNDNILNNPRLSQMLTNPRPNMHPVTLKEEPEVTKKIVYDLTSENDFRSLRQTREFVQNKDNELTWKFALEMIVKELKKTFVDSNIYYQNKEIFDIHNNVTIHRLIIVDWS